MAELRVREARFRDFPQVLAIAEEAFAEEMRIWGFQPSQAFVFVCAYVAQRFLQRFGKAPRFRFYVAEEGRRVVGGAMVVRRPGHAYVQSVMVQRDFRGRGIGRRLVSHGVQEAFAWGAPKVVLHVRSDNVPARRLYEGLGFRPFEERRLFVRESKALPAPKEKLMAFHRARLSPWDPKVRDVVEAAEGPETRAVYGPPQPPRNPALRCLHRWFQPTWLFEREGQAAAVLSLTKGDPARLSLHLSPSFSEPDLAQALLAWGVSRAPGKRLILRAKSTNVPVIQAALALGFQERMREIGMVLEKGA